MAFESENELMQHRRALVAYCYRLAGSLHEAEDLAQETLLRAWKRRASLADGERVRPWLYRIAINARLDAVKSSRRREQMDDQVLDAEVHGPEARYSRAQSVSRAFITSLDRLNPKQRAMLLLRDVLGWSAKETAETLEVSEAAVQSGLQRARAGLDRVSSFERPVSPRLRGLLERYVKAWQERNLPALLALISAG